MNYSIERLLSERGIEPRFRRAGYGMYISPLREEHEASFKVDYDRNLWYDFGTGEGGGVVDLCMRLDKIGFREVLKKLSDGDFMPKVVQRKPAINILSQENIFLPELVDYLDRRGISPEIARGYCSQLRISVHGKRHIVVGFMNDLGGWEMRNRDMKISSSPKTVTTFGNANGNCHLFEGFMDYLSFLTLGGGRLEGSAVVLNSVVNLKRAMEHLKASETIFCYLDNDAAGRRTVEEIRKELPGKMVVDCGLYYRDYKDLNDFLTEKKMEIGEDISIGKQITHIHNQI